MLELASRPLGHKQIFIREIHRRVVIQNRRYLLQLFEHWADTEPLEIIILDVNQDEAIEIDLKLSERFKGIRLLEPRESFPDIKEKGALRWKKQARLGDK